MPTVILLNGVGSAGKSSIAKALQALTGNRFLHVAMDAFLDMLPESAWGHPDGIVFAPAPSGGPPSVAIRSGPVVERLLRGMRRAVAALAEAGNDLVVDDVMLGGEMVEYEALLTGCRLLRVGVFAPLAVLEAREAARGDRMPGLARWQFERVHAGRAYDLELDTSTASPEDCAARILTLL